MSTPILATKLYVPAPRPGAVQRPRLLERLDAGLRQGPAFLRRLTLISAPAGFGKTALVAQWVAGFAASEPPIRAAWLSLDERDSDPARFLTYFIAALQTVVPDFGARLLPLVESSQPPLASCSRMLSDQAT